MRTLRVGKRLASISAAFIVISGIIFYVGQRTSQNYLITSAGEFNPSSTNRIGRYRMISVAIDSKSAVFGRDHAMGPISPLELESEEIMRLRAAKVIERCKQVPHNVRQSKQKPFAYFPSDNKTSFAITSIFKNGYSTWKATFLQAMVKKLNLPSDLKVATVAKIPGIGVASLNYPAIVNSFKERIVIARNPYDRLVSAYKNKVLEAH